MAKKNAFYAQSGGVTAVINASAAGVIETCRAHSDRIGKVYAGSNGIIGALREELIDTGKESAQAIHGLKYTPSGAFGSCRYKLKGVDQHRAEYERLIEVFRAHNIGYFFYNGGGDSADTCLKISQLSETMGYPIQAIHVPKTVDNDLPITDNSPGFGSVAKYVAISTKEAALDVASMCETSTKVFILEVMGRHAGWIAAAGGLAAEQDGDAPHIIIFPEIAFDKAKFLKRVKETVQKNGYCVIVASEGAQYKDGTFLADAGTVDAFGHKQLGGVAPTLAQLVKDELGYKYHAVMPAITRGKGKKYSWTITEAPLAKVANVEKKMPRDYITKDGYGITAACREYLSPLIQGEDYPPYKNGIPQYTRLKKVMVPKKLKNDFKVSK